MWQREYSIYLYGNQADKQIGSHDYSEDDDQTPALTLKKIQIAFHFLWSGFVTAIISLFIEKLSHKWERDKETLVTEYGNRYRLYRRNIGRWLQRIRTVIMRRPGIP